MYLNDAATVAADLLRRHWDTSLPIDPSSIARAEGVLVEPLGWDDHAYSGWYRKRGNQPVILYNPHEGLTRRRFTIAHELGHHALGHGPRPRDGAGAFTLSNYDPTEAEANRFAAELLMPSQTVRYMVEVKDASLARLAEVFKVSDVAMKYRLKNLGLIR